MRQLWFMRQLWLVWQRLVLGWGLWHRLRSRLPDQSRIQLRDDRAAHAETGRSTTRVPIGLSPWSRDGRILVARRAANHNSSEIGIVAGQRSIEGERSLGARLGKRYG
jgi:hypothetical protein